MAFLGLFKKKDRTKEEFSFDDLEKEAKHIDDLDLPPFPSEQQLSPEEAAQQQKEMNKAEVPEELPPIEEVPDYEDFLPMPEFGSNLEKKAKEEEQTLKPEMQVVKETYQQLNPRFELPAPQKPTVAIKSFPSEEIAERPVSGINNPLFIKLARYKEVLAEISGIKSRLNDSVKTLTRIAEMKNPEDSEFGRWKEKIEDIERKILYVDKTLFEKQGF